MTTISMLVEVIREAIRTQKPDEVYVLENDLQSISWKIRSGRQHDVAVDDTLAWRQALQLTQTLKDGKREPTAADASTSSAGVQRSERLDDRQEPAQRQAAG